MERNAFPNVVLRACEDADESSSAQALALTTHRKPILNCLSDTGLEDLVKLRTKFERISLVPPKTAPRAEWQSYLTSRNEVITEILVTFLRGINEINSSEWRKRALDSIEPFAKRAWKFVEYHPWLGAVLDDLRGDLKPGTRPEVSIGFKAGNTGRKRGIAPNLVDIS